jgi:hypothetical protein
MKSLLIADDLHDALKRASRETGMRVSYMTACAVSEYLDRLRTADAGVNGMQGTSTTEATNG